MKFYAVIIEPTSGLGTPLKGDTIFGQFCWEVVWDPSLVEGGLETQLAVYGEKPFLIFSSAFPRLSSNPDELVCALKRPALPPKMTSFTDNSDRIDYLKRRKEEKKKQWMVYRVGRRPIVESDMKTLNSEELTRLCFDERSVARSALQFGTDGFFVTITQAHNSINRLTWTTGEPPFAPYGLQVGYYLPGVELILFVLLNEEATDIAKVVIGLERIGQFGFGRDASTGLGRFRVKEVIELSLPSVEPGQACYTLAPSVPKDKFFETYYFNPFIRFGRHGGDLARSGNPFKNPVVMADEGAVFVPPTGKKYENPYVGKGIQNISKAEPNSVVQGYAPVLPIVMRG